MTDTEATLIAGIAGAIVGGTIGVVGTYLGAIKIYKRQEHNKAIINFYTVFEPTLAFLYLAKKHRIPSDKGISPADVDKFLRDAILNHAAAIEKFRPHISESKGTAYQEAWEKYRYDVCNVGFISQDFNQNINAYEVFESLIHNILQFAKEK